MACGCVRSFAEQNRHIVMLMNNYRAHDLKGVRLKNIQVLFFSSNITQSSNPWTRYEGDCHACLASLHFSRLCSLCRGSLCVSSVITWPS